MMKASSNYDRETCSLCSKFIYKHQPVVVCSMDGNIYHGKCLGFCKDTCFHIQSGTIPDWMCPTCSREVFPCYDDIPDLSHVKCICYNCRLSRGESGLTQNFNPFNLDFDGNFNTFNDSMCDTLNCANTILQSCSYSEPTNSCNVDDSLSKFYFNNIDGFKTNFNESLINIKSLNCIPSLISFCETNLDEDDIHDFNMTDYNAEHLYAIPGKKKGSGLSIYSHKIYLFRRISSLTSRNKFFECIGGNLETEYKELIFITVYRFHGNESEFLEHFMKIILPYKDKPLLILGDFNLNLFEYDNNTNIDDFVNGMISNSLFPLVNNATNFFRGSSTLIDHAWTNILNNSTKCDVVDILTFKSNRNKYDKPRITTGLAKACKVKSKLHNKWIKSRGTMNENAAKTNYKSYRSKFKKLIQQAELNYFKNKFNNASGNIRKTWSVINSIRCKRKNNKLPNFIDTNGIIVTNRREICTKFNDYFVNVAKNLNIDKYSNLDAPDFNQYLHNSVNNSLFLSPITENETYDIINSLDSNKSNDISPKLLKALCNSFCPILTYLFNSCMLSGTFPDELKIARVTPLFKSGNRNLMSNYRPISILPTVSKIFEKLIHVRIYQFLDENQVLYSYQFGFRKAHSTVHAIQTAIHSVTKALDTSYQCMGIFIDFSKAFDTIQHNILLDKLYHYGVRGVAYELISSYLSNRKQFVYCDSECYSAVEDINVGVPQGSVLGPLFFILYVNDIISCAESSVEFILFADDTNIFIYAPTSEELYRKANKVLRQLKSYIDANYLHINLRKCKYIHFRSNRQNTRSNTVSYDNFKFEQVQSIKFLGITISETLVWNEHIKSMTRKLSKITGSLYKIRRCIPKAMLLSVYYALVNSQLMYGISIWGSGGSISNLCCLFSAQKKCIRSLSRVKRISILCPGHTKSTYTAYKILTVHNLYFYSVLTSIFSSLYSCPPQPIVDQVKPHLSKRKEAYLNLPLVRLSNHHKNMPYVGLKLWNSFINVTSTLDILDASRLLYWKLSKFKKFVKDTIIHFQSLNSDVTWDSFNFYLLELEASVLTGNLNPGSIYF